MVMPCFFPCVSATNHIGLKEVFVESGSLTIPPKLTTNQNNYLSVLQQFKTDFTIFDILVGLILLLFYMLGIIFF